MTVSDKPKYQDWLITIANTRLLFNTISELEKYLDNHNIRSNGIKRCYNTEQKARAAFLDLSMYCDKLTDEGLDLAITLKQFEKASGFYHKKLSRKKNPEKVARDILSYYYPLWEDEKYTKSMHYILEEIEEKNYSIPILVLLLLKAWPGYESKEGDVKDFDILYDKVIAFMNDITKNSGYFEQMPTVNDAMQELHKTRITLLNHVKCILSSYADFASPSSIYELSQLMKDNLVDLDIEGYWNEYGGKMSRSDFWLIEKTAYAGMYFATKYNKKQNNVVEKLRYSMQISKSATSLFVYLIHPKAVKHLVNGIAYDEGDHCYYQAERPKDRNDVTELNLTRTYNYKGWENRITLTKVTDNKLVNDYQSVIENCDIVNKYADLEYDFLLNMYAITRDAIYICTADGEKFYKVPIDLQESFSKLTVDSLVGLIVMNSGAQYLAFDEFMIYIPVKKIKKYGIEVVDRIE